MDGMLSRCWRCAGRCWLGGPCGKRLAPFLPEIVDRLRAVGELRIGGDTRDVLVGMSAATIDRWLAAARASMQLKGRSGTKPGSLLTTQIPVRTWSQWDENRPGFVEVDLVGHEGGNSRGEFCQTLTVTDIATGWTETQAVRNKAGSRVRDALDDIAAALPFPLLGIDSDNGVEFINNHLLAYCTAREITFTRSRPGRKNDNAHVEQQNWSVVRQTVGYLRYNTDAELELLNQLYQPLPLMTNCFSPQQKLVSQTRTGAKVIKKHDTAQTPWQRLLAREDIDQTIKDNLTRWYAQLNPAQLRRDLADLQQHLFDHAAAKGHPNRVPALRPSRASTRKATNPPSRAS
jgi:Integrase core domain